MPITIQTNVASLQAQRRLGDSGHSLEKSFERLSSGLRINRASDDAAGLSISATLNANAQIFSSGIRNVNDGISAYNLADSAVGEMKSMLIRMRELSTQASNGTLGGSQRRALDSEFQALGKEYNRIIDTTQFNGRALFTTAEKNIQFAAGDSFLSLSFGASETTGDGTFANMMLSTSPAVFNESMRSADVNGDGKADVISGSQDLSKVLVYLGNGDGTFLAAQQYSTPAEPLDLVIKDVTGDGFGDIIAGSRLGAAVTVLVNNGNGTFRQSASLVPTTKVVAVVAGDINSDGVPDIISGDYNIGSDISIYLGNGDGTFRAGTSMSSGPGPSYAMCLRDVTDDGNLDLVTAYGGAAGLAVFAGNGDGTFRAAASNPGPFGDNLSDLIAVDLNTDGTADFIATDQTAGVVVVWMGTSGGSFRAAVTYASGATPRALSQGDFDGDGAMDLAVSAVGTGAISILNGNGDGTFRSPTTIPVLSNAQSLVVADVNGDGADDVLGGDPSAFLTFLGHTRTNTVAAASRKVCIAGVSDMSLRTISDARDAQSKLDRFLSFNQKLSGSLGASQSRLQSVVSVLDVMRENMIAAGSRITDADVAEESATLLRTQIVQQAASAVLAQANMQPSLALNLLKA